MKLYDVAALNLILEAVAAEKKFEILLEDMEPPLVGTLRRMSGEDYETAQIIMVDSISTYMIDLPVILERYKLGAVRFS